MIIVVSVVDLLELVGFVINMRLWGLFVMVLKIFGVFKLFRVSILLGIVWNIVVGLWFELNVLIWKCVRLGILKEKFILRFCL